MEIPELEKKLLAVARADRPSDEVPYAFEKRIMARITLAPAFDLWGLWERILWRAAAPCVALSVALGVWFAFSNGASTPADPLAVELENTILAPLASLEETW